MQRDSYRCSKYVAFIATFLLATTFLAIWFVGVNFVFIVSASPAENISQLGDNHIQQNDVLNQFHMDVNYAHDWVQVQTEPNAEVTVTMASGYSVIGTAHNDGWFASYEWSWTPEHPNIDVGDVLTAESDSKVATVDPVGSVHIVPDFDNDSVSGTIEADWFSPSNLTVSCEIWEEDGIGIQVDGVDPDGGSYFCDFAAEGWDLQLNQMIAVRYHEPDGDSVINIYDPPWMRVNYADDWVGGDYEAGHTFWITVTENDGVTVKATAELDSWAGGGWGADGFETRFEDWIPSQPDLIPGDRVYFESDDGYYNEILIGDIGGVIDLENDHVSGLINANWFTETLNVECHPWGAPEWASDKQSTAEPDASGEPYLCQWDPNTEWDILPGQEVAVMYQEPDKDRVINVFHEPSPNLSVEKWADGSGQAMPGGPVVFSIRYHNSGDAPAENVTITDTLPVSTTYLADTSGVPFTVQPGEVVWTFGTLDPGEEDSFQLMLTNTANSGDVLHNQVDVYAEFDPNLDDNHAEAQVEVVDELPNLYVNKEPMPGDPAAGQMMLWEIYYGNQHAVASDMVVLTDTIPANTSVVDWYSINGYDAWYDFGSTDDQLILTAPSIPGHWGDTLLLWLKLDETIPVGTQLTNTVEIFTEDESGDTLDDNWQLRDDIWTNDPRWDGHINKEFGWGRLVPGGEIEYYLHVRNSGNQAAGFELTDILAEGTSFEDAWMGTGRSNLPFPPDSVDNESIYWDIGVLEPGEWIDINLLLGIDPTIDPGTVIENCAEISIDGQDNWPYDNQDCVTESINDYGPNLRVTKDYWWNWYEQLAYEIKIENIGSERLDDFLVTDTYPKSTTFNGDWWVNHGPWITMTQDGPNNQVVFWLDELGPGETANVGFAVDLDGDKIGEQGLSFINSLEAPIPDDVDLTDNYAEVTATTGPDIYIEKWVSDGEPRAGEIITFTVEFGNHSKSPWDSDHESGSHITEILPEGMSFISASAPWNPDEVWAPDLVDGNTIQWDWGPMWSQATWYFDLTVQIADTVGVDDVLTNRIEAYSDGPDDKEYNLDNNVSVVPVEMIHFDLYLPLIMR
ncbi:hypothetical protein ACFLXI_05480 [Chloroflexota bacterium]